MTVINTMLKITANVAYLPEVFLVKFLGPICNAHIPNISVNVNVNKTELNPKTNPDTNVMNINVAIVFVVLE